MTDKFSTLPFGVLASIADLSGTSAISAVGRTNRACYEVFNPILYKRNQRIDIPWDSCVLWAAQTGRIETMKRARRYGANLNNTGARNSTDYELPWNEIPGRRQFFASPLHLSLQNGHEAVFQFLLENGAEVDVPSREACACRPNDHRDIPFEWDLDKNWYPLHHAISHMDPNQSAMARLLVEHGAYKSSRSMLGLHEAVQRGRIDLVDFLLGNPKVDASDTNEKGETVLHFASFVNEDNVVEELIRKFLALGVPIDTEASTGTPIWYAMSLHNYYVALTLLNHGARMVPGQRHKDGRGCLNLILNSYEHNAERRQKRLALMEQLIDSGADVEEPLNGQEGIHKPPLWCAVLGGDTQAMRLLLDRGASIDVSVASETNGSKTYRPLIASIFHFRETEELQDPWIEDEGLLQYIDRIRILLEHGARLDPLEDEVSALEYACEGADNGEGECLKMILANSTRKNVSFEHLQNTFSAYPDSNEDQEQSNSGSDVESILDEQDNSGHSEYENKSVRRLLEEFMVREYGKEIEAESMDQEVNVESKAVNEIAE